MNNPLSLQSAQATLQAQPFSLLLDAEVTEFGPDQVEIRLPISDRVKQQHGFVHGGVLSYAADNALTFAGALALGPAVVTSEFKINYLRPAKGDGLIARAHVVHGGKTQAVCRAEVFAVDGGREVLCALAQGTVASLGQAK